jgi:hypothetical protein
MSWLTILQQHLDLVPSIVAAVQSFATIGHSKETTIQKIEDITKVAAAVGEVVPIPQVQAISTLVETVANAVFAPAPATAPPVITTAFVPPGPTHP